MCNANDPSYKQAFQLALRYLSYKIRSEHELFIHLSNKGHPSTCIDAVIKKLKSLHYLDDKKFAEVFVRSMMENQRKGRNLVKKVLTEKGISDEVIVDALSLYPLEKEIKIAKEMTEKFFFQKKSLPLNQLKIKVYHYLLQKGFTKEALNKSLVYLEEDEKFQRIMMEQQDTYCAEAMDLAKKFYEKYTKKESNPFKLKQKIYGQLLRRGYSFDLIQSVIEELL
ncbi:RecX family transcriptional regulator [Clostridium formicaceticum]|uniref:Regulatory protein RecX n=1 Tax=Clostridium formicaceticum TaxID=1497 RepID=A0AAC9RLL8_9CLOT|nr:RecX family transcriptional regulator [Clostridium formicaceticum]AOY77080.1 hypothetical protein BJL90_15225 [Clostridium formicaceticum]ARE87588.1 Regulatory protein RecX [Clostridium formicaceticum]